MEFLREKEVGDHAVKRNLEFIPLPYGREGGWYQGGTGGTDTTLKQNPLDTAGAVRQAMTENCVAGSREDERSTQEKTERGGGPARRRPNKSSLKK